jgi:hypothetical protein
VLARRIGGVDPDASPARLRQDAVVLVSTDGSEQTIGFTDGATLFHQPYQQTAGRVAAFGVLGCDSAEIYAVETSDRTGGRLSPLGATIASAALAPNGGSIAWVRAGEGGSDLLIAITDGSGVRTALGGAPALDLTGWSRDARLLSFSVGTVPFSCPPE